MSLRTQVREAIERGELEAIENMAVGEPHVVRHLLGLTYHGDESVRQAAARSIARASRHHPRLVQDVARRLVWAMNDESGTHATTAPEVIRAIADEQPELLLPLVTDLIRLSGDSGLEQGLVAALRAITLRCPGQVGQQLQGALNARIRRGGCNSA